MSTYANNIFFGKVPTTRRNFTGLRVQYVQQIRYVEEKKHLRKKSNNVASVVKIRIFA